MHPIYTADGLFSKVINFCKLWSRGSWVVLNLAVKRAPQSTSANPLKRVFCAPKYNPTFHLHSQLVKQFCIDCT